MNRTIIVSAVMFLAVIAGMTAGPDLSAQGEAYKTFNATGMNFSGNFPNEIERHRIQFSNVPGPFVKVCLYHAKNVDFDFSVFLEGRSVCYNTEIAPETCCSFKGKGNPKVHISTVQGMGAYQVKVKSDTKGEDVY